VRKIVIAGLTAAGLGLALTFGASAAPVDAAALGALAADPATTVQYYGYRHPRPPYNRSPCSGIPYPRRPVLSGKCGNGYTGYVSKQTFDAAQRYPGWRRSIWQRRLSPRP
jgi:hypothetical protein